MIFIHSGLGGLVIVIGVVAMAACVFVFDGLGIPAKDSTLLAAAGMISAVACWILGRWLNKPIAAPGAKNTKKVEPQYRFDGPHWLLFIRVEYWAIVYVLIAIVAISWGG